jgi:HK97 family phage portal protein
MNILGFEIGRKKTGGIPVEKTISYNEMFAHGLPMEKFFNQVTKPYENIATVYKAIKALCDNVPQAKLMFYDKNTDEEVEDETLKLLFENPNAQQSQSDFIQEWVGYYALYGEGFIKKVQSIGQVAGISNSLPAQLFNLDPSKMKEVVDVTIGQIKEWRYWTMILTPEELIHTKDFNPYNRWRGLSPLKPIADEMEIDQSSLTFNNAFFKNNASAGLILGTEGNLTDDQRKALKLALDSKYAGDGGANAFKTLILEKGLEPKDAGKSTHKEMDFIEQKKLMREEILGIWRTPKALFNITDDLNYATFMGQMRVFWLYGLMPIMRKFEDSLNKYIVSAYNPNIRVAFDYKNTPAFQQDFNERVATGQILSQIGFTGNEINEKLELGFDNQDWRDKWWISFGLVPADESGQIREDQAQANADARAQAEEDRQAQEDNPKDEEGKSLKIDIRKSNYIKLFLKGQGNIERLMESKFSRYFMELRAKILKLEHKELLTLGIDWKAQDERLVKLIKPIMLEGINTGVAMGEMVLGRKKHLESGDFEHRVNSLLQLRMDKITGINDTIKSKLESKLRSSLTEQVQAGASVQQQVDAMLSSVRDFFNMSASRALLIARTESGGAVNGGSMLYYQNEGVEKKEWVTAHDELVRESHRQCEAQGAIPMTNSFQNGLMFPQDQSSNEPEELCNCRCSLLPVVE